MDEAQQDPSEARLKELFDSFDVTGAGSLGQEELTELCRVLRLEEVAPGALQETLLQGNPLNRVHFDQFKEALILILSSTLTNEDSFQEPDSSPEAQPKYIRGGKRYGRRSLPEFQKATGEFTEVTVMGPLSEKAQPATLPSDGCEEHWRSQDSEEYEAEGQLRFWNPDDMNAPQNISPTQDWIEEKLQEVCENLGISRDGHLNRKKLVSICEQYGLQTINTQVVEEVFHNLSHDGTMSIEDFFYGLFKIRKPVTPSASTPYRQLKRHLSMQSFDESGRRTTAPSAMTSTISFRVFSGLDDGLGYTTVGQILDAWHEEGIENGPEILKALDFSLDGKINLTELTLALENELLITKNGLYQAVLVSFKKEIRHLMEQTDQVVREKEKLRSDLEKAEKLKLLMASEVDDHHAAIERQNEYNLSKLDEEYKERVVVLRTELQKDREQIQEQANKQRLDLEQEIENLKAEETYLRDRLTLTLKENSRLESEFLEAGEKLAKYESMMSKLQKNWESVVAEKFGNLDPDSAEFFLQEERLIQMKNEYERQCRELQDRIDELQLQLEEYQAQGRAVRPVLKSSLYEELADGGAEHSPALGSEECNPLNMSIEAEMVIEQMKDQHHSDLCNLQQKLENTVHHYEKKLEETRSCCDREQENCRQKYSQERQAMEEQVSHLQAQVSELQGELARMRQEWQDANAQWNVETSGLQARLEEKASRVEQLKCQHEGELQSRLEEARESFSCEREELIQAKIWAEEKIRALTQTVQEEKAELEDGFHVQLQRLMDKHALEKEQLQQELAAKHQQELQEERAKMEGEFNGRLSRTEEQFAIDRQALASKYGDAVKALEERYKQELSELSELQYEEKSQWEFEKDEMVQEGAEVQERWKELLEKEKAVSSALAQEKDLLEKQLKESLNSMVLEKEQLQKEVQKVKKQGEKLQKQLLQFQTNHKQELVEKDQEMSAVRDDRELLRLKVARLESEFVLEKEQFSSRLLSLELSKQEVLDRAEKEKKELQSKVSTLEDKIEELQQGVPNQLRESKEARSGEEGDSLRPTEPHGSGEVMDALLNQEEFKEPAKDSAVATVLERTPTQSPCIFSLVPELSVDSQSLNLTNQGNSPEKIEDQGKQSNKHIPPEVETEGTIFAETTEPSHILQKAYEKILAENEALRLQQSQLQERIGILEAECDQAACDRQDMASEVQNELEKILQTIPQPNPLLCGSDDWEPVDVVKLHPGGGAESKEHIAGTLEFELSTKEMSDYSMKLEMDLRASRTENDLLERLIPELGDIDAEAAISSRMQPNVLLWPEELKHENQVLKTEVVKLFERNYKLEEYLPSLMSLQSRLEDRDEENEALKEENQQLLDKVRDLEEVRDQLAGENAELQSCNLILQRQASKLEECLANLKALKGGKHNRWESGAKDVEVEKKGLHELNRKLKEKIAALLRQKGTHSQEKEDLNAALRSLQATCSEQQQKVELLRCEAEHLREENTVLRNEIALLNKEGAMSNIHLRELNGSQEELWQQIEAVQKEKATVQKMAENLKKQVSELKAKNQQLELENAELSRKNSLNQADAQDLNQRLLRVLRQREKATGSCMSEERGGESSRLKEELEKYQIQIQNFDDAIQNGNLQISRLKSDLRVSQQEKDALKHEMVVLHKQLQTANEKNRALEAAVHTAGLQNHQKKLCWDELDQLVKQEQQLLRQENERLQREAQSAKADVARSREKIQQLESTILALKHHKQQTQSGIAKAIEQERLSLRKECEQLHKELASANRKISQMNSLEREVETINLENEGLRKKQVKLDEQMMELLHSSSSVMLSPPQQQGCAVVPWEQYQQLQHQFLQAERRSQCLQEELENRPLDTNVPQALLPEQRSVHADTYRRIGHL